MLCGSYCGGQIPDVPVDEIFELIALREKTEAAFKSFDLKTAAELAINSVKAANNYLTEKEPWKLKGDKHATARSIIVRSVLEAVYASAHFLEPMIPDAAASILLS